MQDGAALFDKGLVGRLFVHWRPFMSLSGDVTLPLGKQ